MGLNGDWTEEELKDYLDMVSPFRKIEFQYNEKLKQDISVYEKDNVVYVTRRVKQRYHDEN